jgi:hypothetical protein
MQEENMKKGLQKETYQRRETRKECSHTQVLSQQSKEPWSAFMVHGYDCINITCTSVGDWHPSHYVWCTLVCTGKCLGHYRLYLKGRVVQEHKSMLQKNSVYCVSTVQLLLLYHIWTLLRLMKSKYHKLYENNKQSNVGYVLFLEIWFALKEQNYDDQIHGRMNVTCGGYIIKLDEG